MGWTPVGAPLDIDPARAAGRGAQRPTVAVSAEGNAVVAWGEDRRGRPRARLRPARDRPEPVRVPAGGLAARPRRQAGGRADSIDVDVEDDGSFAWAVFRQDFGGGSRSVARRLLGSTFDPPVALDGGPATDSPRIAINGRGQGLATLQGGGGVLGAFNYNDIFEPAQPLHFAPAPASEPLPASSEHREVIAAWLEGGAVERRLKPEPTKPFDGEVTLSRPGARAGRRGPVRVGADRVAGFAVAMVQGAPGGARTLAVAVHDRPPGGRGRSPAAAGRTSCGRSSKAPGPRPVGPAALPRRRRRPGRGGDDAHDSLVPAGSGWRRAPLPYQVIAIDTRGQETAEPHAHGALRQPGAEDQGQGVGRRAAGRGLRIVARANDGKGSGVTKIRVGYGDSKRATSQRGKRFRGTHSYRRGRFKLRVTALRQRRQPPGQDREAAHLVRLRAGRRELELARPAAADGRRQRDARLVLRRRRAADLEARVARAARARGGGAAIVDVGGESAVGGRPPVAAAEEVERVVPVIERIVAEHDVLVSVDTYKPEVAEAAVAAGAGMVNDVSGLRDPALADVCARTGAALVVMHTRVAPKGTLLDPGAYDDVVADVVGFLAERVALARSRGVGEWQIVLDPGPDFAKTPAQTVAVLRRLDAVCALGHPVLLAVSRKDFLGAITGRGRRRAGRRDARRGRGRGRRRGEHPARPRRRRGRRLPRRPGGPARRP